MINSLARGLRVLKLMAESDGPVSVTEVAEALQVDPSSSYRLLATLAKHGFAAQEARGKKYALGYEALNLAGALLRRLDVVALAAPHLRTLVARTGESAHVAVRDGIRAVFVAHERAAALLRVETTIGSWEPAHSTAVGKVLLAELSEPDLVQLFPSGSLTAFTDSTITRLDELLAELARTRARRYAYDDEEMHPGVRCLAAPVRNHEGATIAAVGISGPVTRLTRSRLPDLSTAVTDVSAAISAEMGFVAPSLPEPGDIDRAV